MPIRYRVRDLSECLDPLLFTLFESQQSTKLFVLTDSRRLRDKESGVNRALTGRESAQMYTPFTLDDVVRFSGR